MEATRLTQEETPHNGDTDRLVVLARGGDKSAERQLLTRHRDRLKRMIAVFLDPRVAPRVDPSDVLQETLVAAARRLPDYTDDKPGGFYPWLRQIAKDRIIDVHRKHIRAEKRSVVREINAGSFVSDASASKLADRLVTSATSPMSQAIRRERHERMKQALDRVSDSYRELLLMRYVEQLSTREIAAALGNSESAVKSKLWRALERMNQIMNCDAEESS
ncbi:MAG: sigma-70 family RNA polymerase sigma factor [Pirellulaceae bacterium]